MIEEAREGYRLIDGRIQHAMIPEAFHVMLVCPREVRAARLYRQAPEKPQELHLANIIARDACDGARYREQYPNCVWEESDFDFVVDTTSGCPEEIARRIFEEHHAWKQRVRLIQPEPA
jgi:cytidylate kinase